MEKKLKINIDKVFDFIPRDMVYGHSADALGALDSLYRKNGKGNDFLGWLDLPATITDAHLKEIEDTARMFKDQVEIIVVIGIGGSYLGTRAVDEALADTFADLKGNRQAPRIVYAGHNIGEDYMAELLAMLDHKKYGIIVISKSGTTTEPAIAFRIIKSHLEKKIGVEAARKLIVAITDARKGALRQLSTTEGYKTYVIPDDVGGRYSVLTPVGLVPIATAGHDIRELVEGARIMRDQTARTVPFEENPAALYATVRNVLYRNRKSIEILVNYNHKLAFVAEWWKQLYGESEGKENVGIFPASVNNTSDLHSMGQYIQEGVRNLFETVISIDTPGNMIRIPHEDSNLDDLNYLSGKSMDKVNKMAELGTMLAHIDGGVPNILVRLPMLNELSLGQLIYFFEIACGISGYMLGINPFDQPGVEAYKKNMFALLEKPGFEEQTRKIKEKLG
ncbi:MAG: glucose-6-phosphate isomerase [Bacteroidales bacterium]